MDALVTAARRGVQVQLLVPGGNNDKEVAQLATDLARSDRITSKDLDAAVRAARTPLRALTGLVARWT